MSATEIPVETISAVLEAAAASTFWKCTNLGPRTEVSLGGYRWYVELPSSGVGNARIAGREGYGGTEFIEVEATPAQTIGIVEASVSALRA